MKENKKTIIIVITIISMVILLSVYEYAKSKAELKYNSVDIHFRNETTNLKSNNVKDALDEINAKVEGKSYTVENKTDFSNGCTTENGENKTEPENDNKQENNIKEVTGKEKEEIENKFNELSDVVVIETKVSEEEKGKEKKYKIDLPEGYNENDEIEVYAYIDGEKIVVPHEIKDGKVVFKTSLEGKFVIGKKNKTNTSNNNVVKGNINNPKTGDINVKGVVILLGISSVVAIMSLVLIIKGGLKNVVNKENVKK